MCFRQELLIFGSAKAGTPLVQANQAIGIDLPLEGAGPRGCNRQGMALLQ